MADRGFLTELMRRISFSGIRFPKKDDTDTDLLESCRRLLDDHGEATGLLRANDVLDRYEVLPPGKRLRFLKRIATELGVDDEKIAAAIDAWQPGDVLAARRLHFSAEPKTQKLIRALNRVPGATARLVEMRAELLKHIRTDDALKGLDADFAHLFQSWFSRGFLELRQIDWSTPANILENIIAYEAVHEIAGWDDLRQRVGDPDRRLFAFFHPAMPSEPLIFVEVALTTEVPGAIAPILNVDRKRVPPHEATTAVFYSISNCQSGLRGISFGNFLIKQVVYELQRELPGLRTFVTLSPVPGMRKWYLGQLEAAESELDQAVLKSLKDLGEDEVLPEETLVQMAAWYLTKARRDGGTVHDPVAHFHLGNGAVLHQIHAGADESPRGIANSWGVMVNYLYDEARIEIHHQEYANEHKVAASPQVKKLADRKGR